MQIELINDARSWSINAWGAEGDKFIIRDGTASTNRLTIDTSGNVGIGTISPSTLLDIYDGSMEITRAVANTGYGQLLFRDADVSNWSIGQRDGNDNFHIYDNDNAVDRITVLNMGGNVGIGTTLPVSKLDVDGGINQRDYYWVEEFDDEASGVEFESGLVADFWTSAGTNYASANVTYTAGVGGTLSVATAGSDDDSVTELGVGNFAINSNPRLEARFKIADANSVYIAVGFAEGSYADKASPDDDIAVVGIDSDTNCSLYLYTNDNNGGLVSDNLGVDLVDGTYVTIRIDLTDTEQPRVWIDNTEISAGSITGTVQAGITVAPYFMVQSLSTAADTLTMDYIKAWQDRG